MTESLETMHPDPTTSLGLALWQVTNQWQRQVRATLKPYDLTQVQFALLASLTWLGNAAPVTQHALAEQAGTDPMMTSQVLRNLESKGYVTRSPHPSDGRAMVVAVTKEGAALANRATPAVEAADNDYFGALDPQLRSSFLRSLHELADR
ncbi:MarR family winged helix-turn-helix transcriptional regulator [Salinibacterium sp. PAMC 21357]|uniref:MarR family winged helix-turn-helix transcriptional regulator n=1 Tax=Salinibacterium sp. PAMC 21357 TaxID=1112215 RepID=UPI000288DAA7|nr:MarR family transcriptional regulator [Salinibacterium sp. PAMC 21357]